MIRPYQPADQEQVEQCIIALQDFERALEPDRVEGANIARRYLLDLLETCQKQSGQLLVAEVDGRVAGFVCVWMEPEPESYLTSLAQYAYISDLVVLPAYRRRALGRTLLAHAETFAVQQGARALRINVLARNAGAWALYRNAGFRDYEIRLLKDLGQQP
jgi:ribosomal protein S18 acetylase RimI-like enzyme